MHTTHTGTQAHMFVATHVSITANTTSTKKNMIIEDQAAMWS